MGEEHRKAGEAVESAGFHQRLGVPPGVVQRAEAGEGCVCRRRYVEMRAVVAVVIAVPEDWTEDDVNNRYVHGTWCANNLVDDLNDALEGPDDISVPMANGTLAPCLCDALEFHYHGEVTP